MTRILIKCMNISINDVLFASSVAKKLKERYAGNCIVDFDSNYLQTLELLKNNPWIDSVYYNESFADYDITHKLIPEETELNQWKKKPSQFQRLCGIKDVDDEYEIYTNASLDYSIKRSIEELKKLDWDNEVTLVAYQCDWDNKSILFTEEECERIDFKSHRNVFEIINHLEVSDKVMLFAVGLETKISKNYPCLNSTDRFTFTASIMKQCDWVVGNPSCLTNMAACMGVKTITTTDYNHMIESWKTDLPKYRLSPRHYYPNSGHIELNPHLRDDQVGEEILRIVSNGS